MRCSFTVKKFVFYLNLLLIVLVQVADVWYLTNGGLWRKGVTSFGFVLIGILNLAYLIAVRKKPLRFPVLLTIGLAVAMLGDIVVNVRFIEGALIFAVGHIFYFIAYSCHWKLRKTDVILSLCIFAASALILTCIPAFDFGGALMLGICLGYALIISFMVGKASGNALAEKSVTNVLLMIGSILFFFSDLMLVLYYFADAPRIVDILCVTTYYPAQCLIGHALYWNKENKNA